MFIMSLKLSKKFKQIILFSTIGCLLAGSALLLNIYNNTNKTTSSQQRNPISLNGRTNQDRIDFFKQYGWQPNLEPCEVSDVIIPKKFDDVFEKYNIIQKKQNMDLNKYKGKLVKHYSYEITNYPNHPENIRGNLLIYEGQIIAVDICSIELDGFIHGITKEYS